MRCATVPDAEHSERASLPVTRDHIPASCKHDDQVDALGLIGQLLDTITSGSKPNPPETRNRDTGYRAFDFANGRRNEWLTY